MPVWFWASQFILWTLVIVQGTALAWLLRLYVAGAAGRGHALGVFGPSVGDRAPSHEIGLAAEAGKDQQPRIVVFMASTCAPCHAAKPLVDAIALEYRERLRVEVVCRGSVSDVAGFRFSEAIWAHPDGGGKIAAIWNVPITPFAVAVDGRGIVAGKTAHLRAHDLHSLAVNLIHRPERRPGHSSSGRAP